MQALAERLQIAFVDHFMVVVVPLGFSALKTVSPTPGDLVGLRITEVGRRGKYLVFMLDHGVRVLIHLSQAARLDIETTTKSTRPNCSVVRIRFTNGSAILIREFGSQRKAGWWLLAAGDDGPLASLGPEPDDEAFAPDLMTSESNRRIHTLLRDQHTVAGVGRGYADDILNAVGPLPFTSLERLSVNQRAALVDAVRTVLEGALSRSGAATADCPNPSSDCGSPCTIGQAGRVRAAMTHCSGCPTSPTRSSIASTVRQTAVRWLTADCLVCFASRPAKDLPAIGSCDCRCACSDGRFWVTLKSPSGHTGAGLTGPGAPACAIRRIL